MLFNSFEFILLFLPISLVVFRFALRWDRRAAVLWLILASLFFYGWWDIRYVGLLLTSIAFNFVVGNAIVRSWKGRNSDGMIPRCILIFGMCGNLCALAYYKYANFFVQNVNSIFHARIDIERIVLPIGISFFTFTQTAFLVDTYRDRPRSGCSLLDYMLFVTYFPHLISGPIYHHSEMIPQFEHLSSKQSSSKELCVGLTVFVIGLFKKIIFADGVAVFVKPVFETVANGGRIGAVEAWGGALAYTLQLYFDFSGYIDMAIGLSFMFGVRLPINFYSPYKSLSIIDFWRRWHITLSRFLRDYLYIPLGGNRKGEVRRYVNILVTMLLGGLWHGAGWTFIFWGGIHGFYLIVNHLWRLVRKQHLLSVQSRWYTRLLSGVLTFGCVAVAWVFFRAPTARGALSMVMSMLGAKGAMVANNGHVWKGLPELVWIVGLLCIAWFTPNTLQIMRRVNVAIMLGRSVEADRIAACLQWQPNTGWAFVVGAMAVVSLVVLFLCADVPEFLYFQF